MPGTLSILDWYALAPGLTDRDAWRRWAREGIREEGTIPSFARIPAMMRRRMSLLGKLGVEVGLTLLEDHPCDFGIFVSRHGELPRTTRQVENLAAGEPVSPTDFSHAVHNAASGLFTIAAKQPVPVTSIAAGEDGLRQGVFEALAYLHQDPGRTVFLIYFDDHVPDIYEPFVVESPACFALGLVLTLGSQWTLHNNADMCDENRESHSALRFLKAWLKGEQRIIVGDRRGGMEWLCQS